MVEDGRLQNLMGEVKPEHRSSDSDCSQYFHTTLPPRTCRGKFTSV
eukprot:gene4390-14784_t